MSASSASARREGRRLSPIMRKERRMRRLRTTRSTRRKLTMLPVPGSSITKAGMMVHRSTMGMKRSG